MATAVAPSSSSITSPGAGATLPARTATGRGRGSGRIAGPPSTGIREGVSARRAATSAGKVGSGEGHRRPGRPSAPPRAARGGRRPTSLVASSARHRAASASVRAAPIPHPPRNLHEDVSPRLRIGVPLLPRVPVVLVPAPVAPVPPVRREIHRRVPLRADRLL